MVNVASCVLWRCEGTCNEYVQLKHVYDSSMIHQPMQDRCYRAMRTLKYVTSSSTHGAFIGEEVDITNFIDYPSIYTNGAEMTVTTQLP